MLTQKDEFRLVSEGILGHHQDLLPILLCKLLSQAVILLMPLSDNCSLLQLITPYLVPVSAVGTVRQSDKPGIRPQCLLNISVHRDWRRRQQTRGVLAYRKGCVLGNALASKELHALINELLDS